MCTTVEPHPQPPQETLPFPKRVPSGPPGGCAVPWNRGPLFSTAELVSRCMTVYVYVYASHTKSFFWLVNTWIIYNWELLGMFVYMSLYEHVLPFPFGKKQVVE